MAQLRLLILDFDGTLADTRKANARAYVAALQEFGFELTEEEYLKYHFGVRCPDFLRSIGIHDELLIERIRLRKIELYPTFFSTLRLNSSLWNFAQDFRRQGGKVWIVSTGQVDNLHNAMRHLGLFDGIDGLLSANDVTSHKPAPDAFLLAMERAGVTPSETLIFEDSHVGVAAAKASGAPYVVVNLDLQ